jgi:hypothetical protein
MAIVNGSNGKLIIGDTTIPVSNFAFTVQPPKYPGGAYHPTVPDMVFKSLEEAKAEFVKWTHIMVPAITGKPERRVNVVFSDKPVYRKIACYNRKTDTITYYTAHMESNLQNPTFAREVVVHECVHVVHFDHGTMFKLVCRSYGVPNPMKSIGYAPTEHVSKRKPWGEVTCPGCGAHRILYKQPRGYPNNSFKCVCGQRNIKAAKYVMMVDYDIIDRINKAVDDKLT